MSQSYPPKNRVRRSQRLRGVVLTAPGGNKLSTAIEQKRQQDFSDRYTLETLNEYTELDPTGHQHSVWALAYAAEEDILISGSADRTLKIWDDQSGACLKSLLGHSGAVWSLAIAPSSSLVASSDNHRQVKLWQLDTGQSVKTLDGYASAVWSVTFCSPSNVLIAGGDRL